MSLLFSRPGERRMVDGSSLFADFGTGRTMAGEPVTFSTAMGLDAVAACLGLLSDVVFMLPLHAYRDLNGSPVKLNTAPQLVADPSLTVDERVWRSQLIISLALWGNAYGLVVTRDGFGYPTTVEWLDPMRVQADETSTLARDLAIRIDGKPVAPGDIVHIPGRYVRPGSRLGMVPLERFRETFGLALAARNFGARWFGDGAHPTGILTSDQVLTPETATTIKTRFINAMRNRREPAVLGAGLKYEQVQVSPNESQFAETQQAAAAAVARAFGLPAEMIGVAMSGSSVTYANREQRAIDFLTFSADPWLVRIEDFVSRQLPNKQYVKFERGALLRTDIKTRYEAHTMAVKGGWHSVNDVRVLEDEAPIDDGDNYLWPPGATAEPKTDGGPQ